MWTAGRRFASPPVPSAVPLWAVPSQTMRSSAVPSVPSWAVPHPRALAPAPCRRGQPDNRLSEKRPPPPVRPRPSTAGPRSPYGPSGRLQPARYKMVSRQCHRRVGRTDVGECKSGGKRQAHRHRTHRRRSTCMPSLTRERARALSLSLSSEAVYGPSHQILWPQTPSCSWPTTATLSRPATRSERRFAQLAVPWGSPTWATRCACVCVHLHTHADTNAHTHTHTHTQLCT